MKRMSFISQRILIQESEEIIQVDVYNPKQMFQILKNTQKNTQKKLKEIVKVFRKNLKTKSLKNKEKYNTHM